ncbi:MAG: endonuclease [Gammaproteobacteria bacterium]|nr:MAG: endonuclease [Gammaproteobacteria bacterium]
MVGAVLTQNTAWSNVERAIDNLRAAGALDPRHIAGMEPGRLGELLRPSGYFNVKAKRLQAFCRWYLEEGGLEALRQLPDGELRRRLLSVHGIGPETADDILLYAFDRPIFVIDAYTRRLFSRLGLISGDEGYEELRGWFERHLGPDVALYNDYHAQIVVQAKEVCRPRPRCEACCLRRVCEYRTTEARRRSVTGTPD